MRSGAGLLGGLAQPCAKGWLRRAEDVGLLERNVALTHAVMRLELIARQVLGEEHALAARARDRRERGEHEKHTGMGRTPHGRILIGWLYRAAASLRGRLMIATVPWTGYGFPVSESVNSAAMLTARAGSDPSHVSGISMV